MILWIDAQLSPALARWLSDTFGVTAHAVRDLGLRDAKDLAIFHAAREAGAVLMSKDSDFVLLLERFGPSPQMPHKPLLHQIPRLLEILHNSFFGLLL